MGTDALDHKSFMGFGKRQKQEYARAKYEAEMHAHFKNKPEVEREVELYRSKVNADRVRLGLPPIEYAPKVVEHEFVA